MTCLVATFSSAGFERDLLAQPTATPAPGSTNPNSNTGGAGGDDTEGPPNFILEHGLHGVIRSYAPRARTGAPLPIIIDIDWQKKGLLEGRFDITILEEGQALARYKSHRVALVPGTQSLRLLLPPIRPWSYTTGQAPVLARWTFIPESREDSDDPGEPMELVDQLLPIPGRMDRHLTVGMAHAGAQATAYEHRVLGSLMLSRFDPEPEAAKRNIVSAAAMLRADSLPRKPMGLLGFDVLVLTHDAFFEIGATQRDAIERWLGAGGSVCVLAEGALRGEHLDWLNRQLSGSEHATRFDLDDDGMVKLRPGTWERDYDGGVRLKPHVFRFHVGLGRLMIVTKPLDYDLLDNSAAWRAVTAFLWRINAEQTRAIVKDGKWEKPSLDFNDIDDRVEANLRDPLERRRTQVGALTSNLIPDHVRVMPLAVVALLLGVLVIAIGPVDYLALGAIRRRKLTWVVFPVLIVAFTWFAVRLSQSYMGEVDQRRTLEVVDIGPGFDGDDSHRVLRRTRFELIFAASDGQVSHELHNAIVTPIEQDDLDEQGYFVRNEQTGQMQWVAGSSRRVSDEATVVYEGNLSGHYTLSQAVQQWSPKVLRTTSWDDAPPPEVDWQTLREKDAAEPGWFHTWFTQNGVDDWLFEAFAPSAGQGLVDLAMMRRASVGRPVVSTVVEHETGWTIYRRVFRAPPGNAAQEKP